MLQQVDKTGFLEHCTFSKFFQIGLASRDLVNPKSIDWYHFEGFIFLRIEVVF